MAIASAQHLLEVLSRTRLLETDQLQDLIRTLPARPADPLALARDLLQRGWLTAYQINQIFQGRAADLALGNYVLLERLGEGGMGQVFKARERRLGRTVALKVLRKERITTKDMVSRFYQEIQAAARLSHPNVIYAYDAEQVGDAHVFAMEYLQGEDLARLVQQNGPLPPEQACDYIRQAADGLQHIHEHGMIHRDIKPANLMRDKPSGLVKILDMGLARLLDDTLGEAASTKLTRLGAVMGTVDYIAPEQALNSHRADIRSDLYSLGCTFYYLLSGQVPFPIDEPMAKLLAHSCDRPVPVEQVRPDVPPRLAVIVAKLMAKHPDDRYQTPAQLALELAPPTPPKSVSTPPPVVAAPAAVPIAESAKANGRSRRRRSRTWMAAAVILSPLVLGLLVHLMRGGRHDSSKQNVHAASDGKTITNSLGMKLVRIAAGDFFMGSPLKEPHHRRDEESQHEVTIGQPFYLGAHLVTVGNFRAFVESAGYKSIGERSGHSWLKPGWEQSDAHPVACLSWNDAVAFCDWLTKKEKRKYRLPTEAEWEYACRAGSTSAYHFGSKAKKLSAYAWYGGNSGDKAHPVGQLRPNAWGLYDMHGNLLQWCGDWYNAKFYDQIDFLEDPHGPAHGHQRVLRGGSWKSDAGECRSASRAHDKADAHRNDRGGFRIVLEMAK